ncbi:DUF1642 domain-containing protein [Enterococcus ureasiticus]|uniref:DUF1642 domain-containing protein n=1 Tax=Enterococcus ureasiticus TaxID=903984 RepID=UPI001A8CDA69|nr:DUF1642 domain-containing protein [Enterococcus ureasiticus]MBO0473266.1 DUF1642 domain-containing protein [Enterococcus ureasiticus]
MGKIEESIEKLEKVRSRSINKDFEDGYNGVIRHALELAKEYKSSLPIQQDEVVVKKYIADWYEKHKYYTLEAKFSKAQVDKDERVRKWYDNCQGRHANERANAQEVIAKMDLIGYTVEKEQMYEVVFYEDEIDRWLLMQLGESSYEIVPESENDGYRTQWFTETEIKAINEKYWVFRHLVDERCQSFAVPVEGGE